MALSNTKPASNSNILYAYENPQTESGGETYNFESFRATEHLLTNYPSRPHNKRKTLIGPVCKGGLNMINFEDVVKSLKFTWVNRCCESTGSHWCARLDSLLSKVRGAFLFQCNFDLKLLNLNNLPPFYKNILKVWQELNFKEPLNANEFKQEFLWNNRFIKTNGN